MKMNILMFSNFDLPDSCAAAVRVWSFAKMLNSEGCSSIIYGVTCEDKPLLGNYDGFDYKLIKVNKTRGLKSFFRIKDLERKIYHELESIITCNKIDAIFLSNIYYDCYNVFSKFSKKYKIPLIINSVEWYDINDNIFKGFYGFIKFIKNRIALKYLHIKINNVVSISSLLSDYYQNKGCNTIVIPTIVDLNHYSDILNNYKRNKKIKLVYAGSPANKDLIINFIYALLKMDVDKLYKFEFHLYGCSLDFLNRYNISQEQIEKLHNVVFFHGRIPYYEVKKEIASADYTVLVRPNKRYANAGFPTKVGESLASGTPVICNLTSDLNKYLKDKYNSIICEDESVESCYNSLIKTLEIDNKKYMLMRKEAYKTALESFSYLNYSELFYNYILKVINEKDDDCEK